MRKKILYIVFIIEILILPVSVYGVNFNPVENIRVNKRDEYQHIQSIFYKYNLIMFRKSDNGWMRVLHSPSKTLIYFPNISEADRMELMKYFNMKYKNRRRLIK
jgi:hypothetical protein